MKSILIAMVLFFMLLSFSLTTQRVIAVSGSWTQMTKADFDSDSVFNLDTTTSPGNVMLLLGGAIAHMGELPINRTSSSGSGFTLIQGAPEAIASVSGLVVSYHFYVSHFFGGANTFELKIFRDNGTHFLLIGQAPPVTAVSGINNVYLSTPLSVMRGDLIGFYWAGPSALALDSGTTQEYITFSDIVTNTSTTTWLAFSTCCIWSVQADIVPGVTGTLISSVKDTGGVSTWGTITWNATVPQRTSLSIQTRSSGDLVNWSPWSANYTSIGASITSPAGRYIQYGLRFTGAIQSPVFRKITITYNTSPSTSSIFLSASPGAVSIGGNVTVTGMISPATSTSIGLTYTRPDGSTINRTVTSNSVGFFSDSYSPDTSGTWKVRASWNGQTLVSGAQSTLQTFTVEAPPSFLSSILPWLLLVAVVAGFAVAVVMTKPKAPKAG